MCKVYPHTHTTINAGEIYSKLGFKESDAGTYTQNFQTECGCDSVVTLILKTSTELEDIRQSEVILIYPNPIRDEVTIMGANSDIRIFNTRGQMVKEIKYSNGGNRQNKDVTLDVRKLRSGVYYVKCSSFIRK